MGFRNLQAMLQALDDRGLLVRIKRPINKDTELMPLVRWQFRGLPEAQRKAFLFENVVDARGRSYSIPVAVGWLAASRDIYALGMGCSPAKIIERWNEAQMHPIKPVEVKTAPVQEEVHVGTGLDEHGGLDEFPIPISTPGFDVAPYFADAHWVTSDPEDGSLNMGIYRAQLKGPLKTGVDVTMTQHIGIHWKKHRRLGKKMEGALVVGVPPHVAYTSTAKLPYGQSEYAVAGGLAQEPVELVRCKTVDLMVPAEAELVVEGEISTDWLEPEAPFGEYPGYMGHMVTNPIFTVRCITHRRNLVFASIMSQFPPSESSKIKHIALEATYYKFLRYDCNIPSVMDVVFWEDIGVRKYTVIRMKKTNPAQPWQALNAAAALDPGTGKIIVVVDEDIDPYDPDSVNWALCWRMQPHSDIRITMGKAAALDPSAIPPWESAKTANTYPMPNGTSAILIDATRKWDYPPVALPGKEYMERARQIWEAEGLPELKPKVPWFGYNLGYWTDEQRDWAKLAVAGEYYLVGQQMGAKGKTIE